MSENNKTNQPSGKFGTEGTNVKRASRARNRTVLLTPEATEEMRSQLAGSRKPEGGSFGGGFARGSGQSGDAQDSAPASGSGNTANAQGFFRPSQNQSRQPDFDTRKTQEIKTADILGHSLDDRLDFNDSVSAQDARPIFGTPTFDPPTAEVEVPPTPTPTSDPVTSHESVQSAVTAPRDSNLDEINRRLKNISSAPEAEAPAERMSFSRPAFAPIESYTAPVSHAPEQNPFFQAESAVESSPPVQSNASFAAPELPVAPEQLDSLGDEFADFEPAAWEEHVSPVAAVSDAESEDLPLATVEQVSMAMGTGVASVEGLEQVEEVLDRQTEIFEEEDMDVKHQSNQDIVWQKETPLVGFLISLNEGNYGKYYELHAGRLVITSEPVAGGSYLLLKNESVSPMHAVLRIAMNGSLQILDQLSENGTKILRFEDGQEVELSGDKAALHHGDVVQLGDCLFSVCLISLREQEG